MEELEKIRSIHIQSIAEELEKTQLVFAYLNNDLDTYSKLVKQYPEYEHIDLFIKIAEHAFQHFKSHKYCSFTLDDSFFSLIDCTFKGYDELYITSKDDNIYMYPMINYDRSCMLYINVPEDFDEDPDKYKDEFIEFAIIAIAENYVSTLDEDAKGLSGKILPNPEYIGEDDETY